MITLNVNISKNWIELDFHGSQRSFEDFNSLWDFCLLTAANKGIYKIRMIHGRGRDADGLAYIDDSMRKRLDRLRGVRWYTPDKGKLGVTLVYLSDNVRQRDQQKTDHQKLMQLSKELKKEELFVEKKKKIEGVNEAKIKTTIRSLDGAWDELLVLETAESLLESGDVESLLRLLSEIKIFEVFYTDDFRFQLDGIIRRLDRL